VDCIGSSNVRTDEYELLKKQEELVEEFKKYAFNE